MVIDPQDLSKSKQKQTGADVKAVNERGRPEAVSGDRLAEANVEAASEGELRLSPRGPVLVERHVEPVESHVEVVERHVEIYDPWQVYDNRDAFKKTAEPAWVVENLLMADSATLVSAQPKAMKSLSLLQACMEAARLQRVWGRFKAPGVKNTLFIETEDTLQLLNARVRGLSKGLGLKDGEKLEGFQYACVGPFTLIDEAERLQRLFDLYKPDFAVISTLQNILGEANWNQQHDMRPVMEVTIKLSRVCPLFVVTHSPQDKKQRRAAGSITQAANFAGALHFEKKFVGGATTVNVKADSKAGAALPKFSLRLETEGPIGNPESVRRLVYETAGKSSNKAIIESAIAENPDISTDELVEMTGTGTRNVQKIRKELNAQKKAV